ncbi:MAG: TonB-dependent receptor plug domain-containing protein, partial [Rhodanobacteraceae bacterium]
MKCRVWGVTHGSRVLRRNTLALAIGSIALGFAGAAWGQSTTGTIHGTVPVAPGETVHITGGAGFNRTVTVGPSGSYSLVVPVGSYTVTLQQNGKAVQSRSGVTPPAAGSVNVSFSRAAAAPVAQTLSTITVTANAIPAIDMSTTNHVTTFTHNELNALPIARNAESIALLSPGVVSGATALGQGPNGNGFLAVGGASIAENAYFVDGMNTTDALTGQGAGVELPYGSIEQQQVYVADLPAKYGRAIGGVVNQIGRSGSNEWHFGFRATWDPRPLRSDYSNIYWANP